MKIKNGNPTIKLWRYNWINDHIETKSSWVSKTDNPILLGKKIQRHHTLTYQLTDREIGKGGKCASRPLGLSSRKARSIEQLIVEVSLSEAI